MRYKKCIFNSIFCFVCFFDKKSLLFEVCLGYTTVMHSKMGFMGFT